MSKPTLPQGTRDFNADVLSKRYFILNTIRSVFELYGFQPLETPAMENLETLMGKYGDEGDRLIFKILNNGLNDPKNKEKAETGFTNILLGKTDKTITERALRYDLTIPFARFIAINHAQLTFPYKRYQIQPVWRADRPQKGRYREFYQCDADVVGSHSLQNEAELALIYNTVFKQLNIPVEIKINSRKLLAALAETCGGAARLTSMTIAIDKLDKIGIGGVKEELAQNGFAPGDIEILENYLNITGTNSEKIASLNTFFEAQALGHEGLNELGTVINLCAAVEPGIPLSLDPTLARGLSYYTGCIFEVKALGVSIGSIGGGGRYDNLTALFGVPNMPGVGISFGIDRIYDVMQELNLFTDEIERSSKVLFFNLGESAAATAFKIMHELRQRNVSCEMYHEVAKFDKQFKYAERKGMGYAAIIGDEELANNTCKIKNLKTGEQQTLSVTDLYHYQF